MPGSPAGQALFFDKKPEPRFVIPDEPYNIYAKSAPKDPEFIREQPRQRSSTLSESSVMLAEKEAAEVNESLPTVFKWEGTGGKPVKQVLISGTFSEWKPLPMVKSHENFVTIIDLPEGELNH
jgi:5'-AMP-activated protein kinase, regulatory beta subunit